MVEIASELGLEIEFVIAKPVVAEFVVVELVLEVGLPALLQVESTL